MITWYKPPLWKRLLGWLGFKRYSINYVYSYDLGFGEDFAVEASGHMEGDCFVVDSWKVRDNTHATDTEGNPVTVAITDEKEE
ncbi:MAG: hypothetical protein CMM93_00915 [Rickettsiales bacterium]|nr:hypothetical protein [Rickettsiales bacterium]|tara:strand:+ start:293 stop:541 length:249 start_codon:yes stop_codon:yes gene_type:complete